MVDTDVEPFYVRHEFHLHCAQKKGLFNDLNGGRSEADGSEVETTRRVEIRTAYFRSPGATGSSALTIVIILCIPASPTPGRHSPSVFHTFYTHILYSP